MKNQLVPSRITDKNGKPTTVYVNPNKGTPASTGKGSEGHGWKSGVKATSSSPSKSPASPPPPSLAALAALADDDTVLDSSESEETPAEPLPAPAVLVAVIIPNRFENPCSVCETPVAVGKGHVFKAEGSERWVNVCAAHKPVAPSAPEESDAVASQEPASDEPKAGEVIEIARIIENKFEKPCAICGTEVAAQEGYAYLAAGREGWKTVCAAHKPTEPSGAYDAENLAEVRRTDRAGRCKTCGATTRPFEDYAARTNSGRWISYCSEHVPEGALFRLPEAKPFSLPGTNAEQLYPHQQQVVAAVLAGKRSIYIADEPGLGKTASAILSLAASESKRSVVVVPSIVKTNWRREFEKWNPSARVQVISGKKPVEIAPDAEVIILNYELLEAHAESLSSWAPTALVVDEAHYVKNYRAKRSQALETVNRALAPSSLRIFLSGTPIPNRVIELASPLINLGWMNSFGGFHRFGARYTAGEGARFDGSKNTEELHERLLETGMIRRRKTDVVDLPSRSVNDLPITLSTDDARSVKVAQKALLIALERSVKEAAKKNSTQVSAQLIRATVADRLASGGAGFSELGALRMALGKAKIPLIARQAEDLLSAGEPVVVFAHHREVVTEVADRLGKEGRKVGVIIGGQGSEKNQRVMDAFQNGDLDAVVASTSAAGVGITLNRASQVVIGELAWNGAQEDQAIDRVHRIGQERPVTAWRIIAEGTIDGQLSAAITRKRRVATEVIDGTSSVEGQTYAGAQDVLVELLMKRMKVKKEESAA